MKATERRTELAALATIAALAVFTYRRAAAAYFFEDDFQWLVTRLGFHPTDVLNIGQYNHFYRPIIELYFYAGVRLFGHAAAGFHLASIGVHAVNGLLVYAVTRAVARSNLTAFAAGVIFVVLPGYVDAVAWVGAVAEPLVTLFGCASIVLLILYLRTRAPAAYAGSIAAFAAGLLTHESGVTFLPLLVAAGWLCRPQAEPHPRFRWSEVRVYAPYLILLALYGAIDVLVNRRNYLVEEGHYRVGLHAVGNILDYVVALYVGKHILASYVAIAVVAVALLWRGSPAVRFATAWIFITLLPFAFFTWGNTSRYVYTPAVGFAMLLAIGVSAIDRFLQPRTTPAARLAIVWLLVLAGVIRFSVFTNAAVKDFVARTEAYRAYAAEFRAAHPVPSANTILKGAPLDAEHLHAPYVAAMLRWEYGDPDLRVEFGDEVSSR